MLLMFVDLTLIEAAVVVVHLPVALFKVITPLVWFLKEQPLECSVPTLPFHLAPLLLFQDADADVASVKAIAVISSVFIVVYFLVYLIKSCRRFVMIDSAVFKSLAEHVSKCSLTVL